MSTGDLFLLVFLFTAALLTLGAQNLTIRKERDQLEELAMQYRAHAARPCERCNNQARAAVALRHSKGVR